MDYQRPAAAWLTQAVSAAGAGLGVAAGSGARLRVLAPLSAVSSDPMREHPLEVEVIANQVITGRGSLRAVHHLELALPPGRFEYHPGDALGVVHENPPEVVERVLELAGLDGHAPVSFEGRELPLHGWLRSERELTRLTRPFVDATAPVRRPAASRRRPRTFRRAGRWPTCSGTCPSSGPRPSWWRRCGR